MDHSAKPMVELIVARKRLMGQLAWPKPKIVLNDVQSCPILTKLFLRAHEVQENEEISHISWQMNHSTQPMIEPIQASHLAFPKVCKATQCLIMAGSKRGS